MTTKMTDERCWELVEQIGWKQTEDKGVDVREFTTNAKKSLLRTLTPDEANAFSNFVWERSNALDRVLTKRLGEEDCQDIWLGDDGFSDLIHHIIGCGKEQYEATLANPDLAIPYARNHTYVESFAYAVPRSGDFEDTKIDQYVERAQRLLTGLDESLANETLSFVHRELRVLRECLLPMTQGDYKAFLETERAGRQAAQTLKNYYYEHIKALMGQLVILPSGIPSVLTNEWATWNLYSDVRLYCEFF